MAYSRTRVSICRAQHVGRLRQARTMGTAMLCLVRTLTTRRSATPTNLRAIWRRAAPRVGILSNETCSTALATLPLRPDVRKISTQWHGTWRLPTKIAEPNRLTTNTYNGDGGVYCAPAGLGVLCKKTIQGTTDATGQQGLPATVTGTPRVWQYTYDAYGQVLTATDPNNKTTTT